MGKQEKILVVDDFEPMRKTIDKCLINIGYTHIETCSNGQCAWEVLCDRPFDMIISDLNMPKMNGIELLSNVRSDLNLKSIPFIMVTANCEKSQILTAIERGVSEFIVKPFIPVLLQEKIIIAINTKSPRIFPSLINWHEQEAPKDKPQASDNNLDIVKSQSTQQYSNSKI